MEKRLRSISYYGSTLDNLIKNLQKPFNQVETEDLRVYLSEYQKRSFYLELRKT